MIETDKSRARELINAIARLLTASIPPENRPEFAAVAPRLIEEAISSVLGCDSVKITGWAITPTARQERRARILDALQRGDAIAAIASRELVSISLVYKLREGASLE